MDDLQSQPLRSKEMDWNICCLCQTGRKSDDLTNPRNTGCVDRGDQLADFERLVEEYIASACWPKDIVDHERWNDGQGGSVKDWFKRNNAV